MESVRHVATDDVSQTIQRHVSSVGRSGIFRTTCPICSPGRKNSKQPVLFVNEDAAFFYCHHCGETGFYRDQEGWNDEKREQFVSEHRAAQQRAAQRPTTGRREEDPPVRPAPLPPAPQTAVQKCRQWLASRGIDYDEMEKRGLVAATEEGLVILYRNTDGEIINTKTRFDPITGKKGMKQSAGAELSLFNIPTIQDADVVWLVEGELDALALIQAGIQAVTTVPNGTPKNAGAASMDYLNAGGYSLAKAAAVVLAGDNDEPGLALQTEIAGRVGRSKTWRVTWPDGCKDANDVLITHGPETLKKIATNYIAEPHEGIIDHDAITPSLIDYYQTGKIIEGMSTGFGVLDEFWKPAAAQLTIVTGVPGSGKSRLIDHVLVNMAEQHGIKIAIYSPESWPTQRHAAILCAIRARRPFNRGAMSRSELDEAWEWVQDHFHWIMPPEPTIDSLIEIANEMVDRYGVDVLVLDPWNELDHSRPPALSETEYISMCLGKIRRLGWNRDIHPIVIAHPTKLQKDADGRYPVVTPYDIAGSAAWFAKADNIISVWRDRTSNLHGVEVHIQKIRWQPELGKLGMVELGYEPATYRFFERDKGVKPAYAQTDIREPGSSGWAWGDN